MLSENSHQYAKVTVLLWITSPMASRFTPIGHVLVRGHTSAEHTCPRKPRAVYSTYDVR